MNKFCKNLIHKSFLARNALANSLVKNECCSTNIFSSARDYSLASICVNPKINLFTFKSNTSIRCYKTNTYNLNSKLEPKHRDERSQFGSERSQLNSRSPKFEKEIGTEVEELEGNGPLESEGEANDYHSKTANGFENFDLPKPFIDNLIKLGYDKPFEIQEATLKYTLAGKDLVGKAFTGSGKTLAFAIPIINKIFHSENVNSRYPKCLVLAPTRELCIQLSTTIQKLAPGLKCVSIYGGARMQEQIQALEGNVDIVCATPGRLQDLINRKNFKTESIEIICLDEADQLLNTNFLPQIEYLIEKTDREKQLLMFSATINKNVVGLVNNYMKDPVLVDLTKGQKYNLPTNIEHFLTRTNWRSMAMVAKHFISTLNSERCILFTNRKVQATDLSLKLNRMGIKAADLHSDISQMKREVILNKFRKGNLKVICATDVAARGIDIPEIDLILHVDAPQNGIDFYIHRSGRTGRAGRAGKSVIIDTGSNREALSDLNRVIKFKKLDIPSEILNSVVEDEDNDRDEYSRPSRDGNSFSKRFNNNSQFNSNRKFDRFGDKFERDSGNFKQRYPSKFNNRNLDD